MSNLEGNKQTKKFNCERCGREIKHRGRCLPCNYFYKHKQYFPGLKENPKYDKLHNISPTSASKLIKIEEEPPKKKRNVDKAKEWLNETIRNFHKIKYPDREYQFQKICKACNNKFLTNKEAYQVCFFCFKFFSSYGRIESYEDFLIAFNLIDKRNSRYRYVEFVDWKNRLLKYRKNWSIEDVLANPSKYLDEVSELKKKS
ncbi:hypothetical protein HYW99_02550 [Candidatus Woesearchaeota archaeon]|nr:hypothetical protein [Candidatus Woesearchaeota archaeon]